MAALAEYEQHFFDVKNGELTVGFHRVTLVSTSDTITVPRLSHTTSAAAASQLRRSGDSAATVTSSGAYTVTIVGAVAQEVIVVTLHEGLVNSFPDA